MSYCELKIIKDNKVEGFKEFRNASGGASFIWTAIYDKYVKNPMIEYDSWLMNADKLWPLWKDKNIPEYQRLVLASTFDNVVIEYEKLSCIASYFRDFVDVFENKEVVCHLLDWADCCDEIYTNETKESCQGVCFYQMSVSEDPWEHTKNFKNEDEEEDYEYVPYDLIKGDKHWFLFQEFNKDDK